MVDVELFRSFLAANGTLPPFSLDNARLLPPDVKGVIGAFLSVNTRGPNGRRRIVPRGVDMIIFSHVVALAREEREGAWETKRWREWAKKEGEPERERMRKG